jgi:kynureninase
LLEEQGQSIALVLLSGIQFYTGQLFDIETITRVAQQHVNFNILF